LNELRRLFLELADPSPISQAAIVPKENHMPARVKLRSGLKHGGYSATAVLPGENRAEFEKLHRELIAEFCPDGVLELDIVAQIARLVWRKKNLSTYRIAEIARERFKPFISRERRASAYTCTPRDEQEIEAAECAAMVRADEHRAREELGDNYELVAIGELATIPRLLRELNLEERLSEMIDRNIKHLLHMRGLKSINMVSSPATPQRLSAPTKAA
jgi:hypothetical protein